jgi:two-component system response regulator AtoC
MVNKNKIKIAIIDDNSFYNQLLSTRLKSYLYPIGQDMNFELEIQSFIDPYDSIRKLDPDTDIVFLDYYLGPQVTGSMVMNQIKKQCENCNIIVISQVKSLQTSLVTLLEGASEFILKDKNAFTKSCYVTEEMIYSRLRYAS